MTIVEPPHEPARFASLIPFRAAVTNARIALLIVAILLGHDLVMGSAAPVAHADAIAGLHANLHGHQHVADMAAPANEAHSACGAFEAVRAPDRVAPDADTETLAMPVPWPDLAVRCTVTAPDAPEPGIPSDRSRALLQVFLI